MNPFLSFKGSSTFLTLTRSLRVTLLIPVYSSIQEIMRKNVAGNMHSVYFAHISAVNDSIEK